MTYRAGQPNLPWLTTTAPTTHSSLPPMEPLAPNPLLAKQPQPTQRKRQARPGTQARRASKRETHANLVQAAQEQPRDSIGRFAEKGNFLTRLFDPTPRAPTHLKPLKQASPQRHPLTTPPRARASKRKSKKPVPERSVFGRIIALFNGDYTRWRMRNLREQARLRAQIDGYYPPPKKRMRRQRKTTSTARPTRPARKKRGIVRRILGF